MGRGTRPHCNKRSCRSVYDLSEKGNVRNGQLISECFCFPVPGRTRTTAYEGVEGEKEGLVIDNTFGLVVYPSAAGER